MKKILVVSMVCCACAMFGCGGGDAPKSSPGSDGKAAAETAKDMVAGPKVITDAVKTVIPEPKANDPKTAEAAKALASDPKAVNQVAKDMVAGPKAITEVVKEVASAVTPVSAPGGK